MCETNQFAETSLFCRIDPLPSRAMNITWLNSTWMPKFHPSLRNFQHEWTTLKNCQTQIIGMTTVKKRMGRTLLRRGSAERNNISAGVERKGNFFGSHRMGRTLFRRESAEINNISDGVERKGNFSGSHRIASTIHTLLHFPTKRCVTSCRGRNHVTAMQQIASLNDQY